MVNKRNNGINGEDYFSSFEHKVRDTIILIIIWGVVLAILEALIRLIFPQYWARLLLMCLLTSATLLLPSFYPNEVSEYLHHPKQLIILISGFILISIPLIIVFYFLIESFIEVFL